MVVRDRNESVTQYLRQIHRPVALKAVLDEPHGQYAATQLGQLNLHRLLGTPVVSRAKNGVNANRKTYSCSSSTSVLPPGVADFSVRGGRPASRSYSRGNGCISDTDARPRSSSSGGSMYKRDAGQGAATRQTGTLHPFKAHSLLHSPATTLAASPQSRPATASVLLENHRRLSPVFSDVPADARAIIPNIAAHELTRASGTVPSSAEASAKAVMHRQQQQTQKLQPLQLVSSSCGQHVSLVAAASPTPVQAELASSLAHIADITTLQAGLDVDKLRHQLDAADLECDSDNDLASEHSSSSDSSDSSKAADGAGSLLGMSPTRQDTYDCLSVNTDQAATDASSSIGDTDMISLLAQQGQASSFLTPSLLGMMPTVAFVGLRPDADVESCLTPLRYVQLVCACYPLATSAKTSVEGTSIESLCTPLSPWLCW